MRWRKGSPLEAGEYLLAMVNTARDEKLVHPVILHDEGHYGSYEYPENASGIGPHMDIVAYAKMPKFPVRFTADSEKLRSGKLICWMCEDRPAIEEYGTHFLCRQCINKCETE